MRTTVTAAEGLFDTPYVQLVTAFLYKLIFYYKNKRTRVTHLLATGMDSLQGIKVCQLLGMNEVGRDRFNDPIYEVEIDKVDVTEQCGRCQHSAAWLASIRKGRESPERVAKEQKGGLRRVRPLSLWNAFTRSAIRRDAHSTSSSGQAPRRLPRPSLPVRLPCA